MTSWSFPSVWVNEQGPDAQLLGSLVTSLSGLGPIASLGLAVSGGGDSMAMLHLMARLGEREGWQLEAVTVDHRLRPEAADEAAFVARACASLGVGHSLLAWDHGEISGNLMDQARVARYALMAGWARDKGISLVALGHTADDQAETVLMGLARKAGVDGLSGMRSAWRQHGILWTRPLLDQTRATLRGYLRRHWLDWRDDPTNDDPGFSRIKARRALTALAPLGIDAETLAAVAGNLDMARSALVRYVAEASRSIASEAAGAVTIERAGFLALPLEIQRRLLISSLRWVASAEYPPRENGVNRVQAAILTEGTAMLAGCRVRATEALIQVTREPKAVENAEAGPGHPWDRRWHLSGPFQPGQTIRALGAEGLRQCPDWRTTGLPREALIVTPAVWQGTTLIAAPLARPDPAWPAEVRPDFAAWIAH